MLLNAYGIDDLLTPKLSQLSLAALSIQKVLSSILSCGYLYPRLSNMYLSRIIIRRSIVNGKRREISLCFRIYLVGS